MFEVLFNLILTGVFLQSRVGDQPGLVNNRLPQEELTRWETVAPRRSADNDSLGVLISAKSAMVLDDRTGKVLYQKNADEQRSIASLTKLMAALVANDYLPDWSKEVMIQSDDYRAGGVTYLIAGDKVSVYDLFYTSLIASANEASAALARATGLSEEEFITKMNEKAKQLKMQNTVFADMTGLDSGNRSTAADISLLIKAILEKPSLKQIISSPDYLLVVDNKNRRQKIDNTDKILAKDFGWNGKSYRVEAGKTGFLESAGYCFASRVVDDKDNRIITVVLGSDTIDGRFTDTKSLAYWVFNNYLWP